MMKWPKFIIGIFTAAIITIYFCISAQELNNEGRDYWQLQLLKFYYKSDFAFKSFENGYHRPVIIEIPAESSIENIDIPISIENKSFSNFFTLSFNQVLPTIYLEFIEKHQQSRDTFSENLYGCGTEMFTRKIEANSMLISRIFNPYIFYLEGIQLNETNFVIPDSLEIKFQIYSYSLPWSCYRSEMISSNSIKVDHEKISEDLSKYLSYQSKTN